MPKSFNAKITTAIIKTDHPTRKYPAEASPLLQTLIDAGIKLIEDVKLNPKARLIQG